MQEILDEIAEEMLRDILKGILGNSPEKKETPAAIHVGISEQIIGEISKTRTSQELETTSDGLREDSGVRGGFQRVKGGFKGVC